MNNLIVHKLMANSLSVISVHHTTLNCMFISISFLASNNSTMLTCPLLIAHNKAVSPVYIFKKRNERRSRYDFKTMEHLKIPRQICVRLDSYVYDEIHVFFPLTHISPSLSLSNLKHTFI
jgi:hypothetical protein